LSEKTKKNPKGTFLKRPRLFWILMGVKCRGGGCGLYVWVWGARTLPRTKAASASPTVMDSVCASSSCTYTRGREVENRQEGGMEKKKMPPSKTTMLSPLAKNNCADSLFLLSRKGDATQATRRCISPPSRAKSRASHARREWCEISTHPLGGAAAIGHGGSRAALASAGRARAAAAARHLALRAPVVVLVVVGRRLGALAFVRHTSLALLCVDGGVRGGCRRERRCMEVVSGNQSRWWVLDVVLVSWRQEVA
jgi:hypothetical protein